jgi:putative ABC transport system ATP-binding protein
MHPVLVADNVRRIYTGGETPVEAVRGVSLVLEAGDFVAVVGPSGCGKSTLLHVCGAMDQPTSGHLEIEGVSLAGMSDQSLTRLRRERIGFVFQFFNLLPTLTVLENIGLPLLLAGCEPAQADRRARELADRVGLPHRTRHYPQQLSGGEMQRAAIARAVVHNPALVVADEPTGNLDSDNGSHVLHLLMELNSRLSVTILLATHAPDVATAAGRVLHMRDGLLESADPRDKRTPRSVAPF